MSRAALDLVHANLPADTEAALAAIEAALGDVTKPSERAALAHWLWSAPPAPALAQAIIRRFSANTPTHLEPVVARTLPVAEASGLAIGPGGALYAVDDDRGLFLVRGDEVTCLATPTQLGIHDLEGLCRAPGGRFLVLSEGGAITEFDPTTGGVRAVGALPVVGRRLDKGYEGIDLLPAHLAPSRRPTVVAVNECDPAVVVLAPLDDLDRLEQLPLPADLVAHLADLSDVAVHPETGDLLLLSDVSRTVARVRIVDQNHLETVGCWALGLPKHSPEGLAFDAAGQLWVAADGAHEVFVFWLPSA